MSSVRDYTIVTQYPDVEVVGNTQTKAVQVIGVVSIPNEVYFEVRVPRAQATTANIQATAQSYRDIYELVMDEPGVADVTWRQEPTVAGQLQDWVTIYVTSSSGDSTGVIDVPFAKLGTTLSGGKIAALRKSLNATEAT